MTTLHRLTSNRARLAASCAALSCSTWMHAAVACPGPECEGGEVFPRVGVLPANHVAFVWQRTDGLVDEDDSLRVTKRSAADPASRELTLAQTELAPGKLLLTSAQDLVPGDVLELEYTAGTCALGLALNDTHTTITLGPEAPLPTELGAMTVSLGEGNLDYKGVCWDHSYRAYAKLDITFADEALPFKDLFMLSIEVNGVQRRGRFYLRDESANDDWRHAWPSDLAGRGAYGAQALLSADCNDRDTEDGQLLAGTYEVNLVGTLPDGTTLRTPRVEVTLECERPVCSASTEELDALCSEVEAGVDAGTASPADAGFPACDASSDASEDTTDDLSTKPSGQASSNGPTSLPRATSARVDCGAAPAIPAADAQAQSDAGVDTPDNVNAGAKKRTRRRNSGCSVGVRQAASDENGAGAVVAVLGLVACIGVARRRRGVRA